ncbi:unnamed protein product [Lampetra planeri]
MNEASCEAGGAAHCAWPPHAARRPRAKGGFGSELRVTGTPRQQQQVQQQQVQQQQEQQQERPPQRSRARRPTLELL